MSSKDSDDVPRGPKGGRKHTPGRGHDRKSRVRKDLKRRRKAERRRAALGTKAREQWMIWDSLTTEQRKMRPDLRPTLPRPDNGSHG
jgi:hypothetical protein